MAEEGPTRGTSLSGRADQQRCERGSHQGDSQPESDRNAGEAFLLSGTSESADAPGTHVSIREPEPDSRAPGFYFSKERWKTTVKKVDTLSLKAYVVA